MKILKPTMGVSALKKFENTPPYSHSYLTRLFLCPFSALRLFLCPSPLRRFFLRPLPSRSVSSALPCRSFSSVLPFHLAGAGSSLSSPPLSPSLVVASLSLVVADGKRRRRGRLHRAVVTGSGSQPRPTPSPARGGKTPTRRRLAPASRRPRPDLTPPPSPTSVPAPPTTRGGISDAIVRGSGPLAARSGWSGASSTASRRRS